MIERKFNKDVLADKLLSEITSGLPNLPFTLGSRSNQAIVRIQSETISTEDDQKLSDIVNAHVPSSSLADQEILTEERTKEGYEAYKRIFAHISDSSPIGAIDPFLSVYPDVIVFRCCMKDGQYESALRQLAKHIEPKGIFPHISLYKLWVRELAKKYNKNLTNEALDMIETAESI